MIATAALAYAAQPEPCPVALVHLRMLVRVRNALTAEPQAGLAALRSE